MQPRSRGRRAEEIARSHIGAVHNAVYACRLRTGLVSAHSLAGPSCSSFSDDARGAGWTSSIPLRT